jgi:phytoene dehydrogenase-like protein
VHDVCSAIHPMALASPFFRSVPLAAHGLEWIQPPVPLAHPLDDGQAVVLRRSIEETAAALGVDADAYRKLMRPMVSEWKLFSEAVFEPFRISPHSLVKLARFGLDAIRPARRLAESVFKQEPARALFAGLAAHSMLPLERWASAAFGLVLGLTGHTVGWPMPRGGSQKIADSLAAYLRSLGGEVQTGVAVRSLDRLPPSRLVLCDLTPRQLLRIAGVRLTPSYRRQLQRYKYGPGVFKLDWALGGPIPWKASACAQAGTVHLGGTLDEIARSERAAWQGAAEENPFVLLAQPSLFDSTRAPAGKHTAWAYCHVPNGSEVDMTARIEQQVERFAPGFRDLVLAKSVLTPVELEDHNPNLVGGDISGGANNLGQLFARPTLRTYRTSVRKLYLCSASTPPGAGVHGMCGYFAARLALRDDP